MTATSPHPGVRLDALLQLPDLEFGVTPYRRETVRLPARTVLEHGVGTMARGEAAPPMAGLRPTSGARGRGRRPRPRRPVGPAASSTTPLTLRTATGTTDASIVVGESPAALQRALRDQLVRTSDADVQRLAELSADRTTRGSEQFLEALQGRGRYGEPTSQLLWCRPVFEVAHPVAVPTTTGATLRAPGLRDTPVGVVAATRTIDHGGHAVPRRAFVLAVGPRGRPVVHDGRRLVPVLDVDRVPEDVLEALDRDGAVEPASLQALLPLRHLVARCLVRVPGRAELAALGAIPARPRARLLTRPALAFDSRSPIELRGREPVIDDPALGAWVFARVSQGTFLPGDDAPRRLDPAHRPDAPSWLVLTDVGLGL